MQEFKATTTNNVMNHKYMEFTFHGMLLTTIIYDGIDNMEVNSAVKAWYAVPHYDLLKIEITIDGKPFSFDESMLNRKGESFVRRYQEIFDPCHLIVMDMRDALNSHYTINDVIDNYHGEVRDITKDIAKSPWYILHQLKLVTLGLLLFLSLFCISCNTANYIKVPKAEYETQQQKLKAADSLIDMLWEDYPDIMLDVYSETDTYQVLVGE